jgi:hypothetical protein
MRHSNPDSARRRNERWKTEEEKERIRRDMEKTELWRIS